MIPKYCEIQGDNTDLGGICEKIFSSLTGKIGLWSSSSNQARTDKIK